MNELVEAEFKRIAQNLHDEAGQLLTAVHLKIAHATREAPQPCREHFQEIQAMLEQVEVRLRRLSHELHPAVLADLGLVPALEVLVEGISERSGIAITLQASLDRSVASSLKTVAYRVVQEALMNLSRHSGASEALVEIRHEDGALRCIVRDNGIGFDLSAPDRKGLGLQSIRRRVEAVGGRAAIRSSPGSGTEVVAVIPRA